MNNFLRSLCYGIAGGTLVCGILATILYVTADPNGGGGFFSPGPKIFFIVLIPVGVIYGLIIGAACGLAKVQSYFSGALVSAGLSGAILLVLFFIYPVDRNELRTSFYRTAAFFGISVAIGVATGGLPMLIRFLRGGRNGPPPTILR